MRTQVYINETEQSGEWTQIVLPVLDEGNDALQVWLLEHFGVRLSDSVSPAQIPEYLQPRGSRWTVVGGRTINGGQVLVITDNQGGEPRRTPLG